jgi:hypothetical protein
MLPEKLQGYGINDYLVELTKRNSKLRHTNYEKTVDYAKEMGVHAWGNKPVEILERARPREEADVRKYRLDSWEPTTLSKFNKCISICQKMFNEKLYSINFPAQPSGPKILENETLQKYILEDYPEFDSVFMFAREVLLKQMIADPNAVIAIVPTQYELEQSIYQKPFAVLFNSSQVLDFEKGSYFALKDQNTVFYKNKTGQIIHIITTTSVLTYHEAFNEKGESYYILASEYIHNFGLIPVWFLGGTTNSQTFPYYYESFFGGALPHWNKAIKHESDLDGVYVNHVNPKQWELTIDCDFENKYGRCSGGVIRHLNSDLESNCPRCKGSGRQTVKGPYDIYSVQTDKFTEKPEIIPPAGYIQGAPIELIDKLENRVEKCINYGLEAINMEIVNMIGANQSGVAKEYDRTELNSFLQQVADYIFDNHIPNIIYFINRYRYGVILKDKYRDYEPIITKPTSFDTLSIKELTTEIAEAKNSQVSPDYITALEKDAASKRFSTNSEEKEKILAILDLNPFNNYTVDDKMNMGLDGTVSKIDVVISNNITQFVERAILEVTDFLKLDRRKQKELLKKYAEEVVNGGQTSAQGLLDASNLNGEINTPVDIEAEAKAKLKGSVGGVQGILAIQQQVSEGVTSYQAGLAILELIYGIVGDEGRRILGDEGQIKKAVDQKAKTQIQLQNEAGPISK